MLFLRLHHQEIVAAEILWGLWLFPLGILVYRSRFLPRFLGVWLIINGFAYPAMSFTGLLLPAIRRCGLQRHFSRPTRRASAFMLWLVIQDVSRNRWALQPHRWQLIRLHFVGCRPAFPNRVPSCLPT